MPIIQKTPCQVVLYDEGAILAEMTPNLPTPITCCDPPRQTPQLVIWKGVHVILFIFTHLIKDVPDEEKQDQLPLKMACLTKHPDPNLYPGFFYKKHNHAH